jgi:16S rRNA (cytosine1402-N4)-methyltransferase
VSSMQLEDASRGMSFRAEGPLDMRMDTSRGQTARELIDALDDDELANVLYQLGEERRSRRIARCIKQALENGELTTTMDLRRAVVRAVGPARVGGVDPATRTFQALRIAVNAELAELSALIAAAERVVAPGGTLAVISFHSLEDRIVKRALKERAIWQPVTKKPITPGEDEVRENPRARSAKLRAARRVDPAAIEERAHESFAEADDAEVDA